MQCICMRKWRLELLGVGILEGDCPSSSSCTPVIPVDNMQGSSPLFLACLSGWWTLLHRTVLNELIGFPCLDQDPEHEKQWITASYCVVVRAGNDSLRVISRLLFATMPMPVTSSRYRGTTLLWQRLCGHTIKKNFLSGSLQKNLAICYSVWHNSSVSDLCLLLLGPAPFKKWLIISVLCPLLLCLEKRSGVFFLPQNKSVRKKKVSWRYNLLSMYWVIPCCVPRLLWPSLWHRCKETTLWVTVFKLWWLPSMSYTQF